MQLYDGIGCEPHIDGGGNGGARNASAVRADGLVVRGMPIDEIGDRALNIGVALHELSAHAGSPEELFLNWTSDPSADKKGSQP